jgi:hypothetical protein
MVDIEPRVTKLESDHNLLAFEFQTINKTLSKIEEAIEKQNEISSDVRSLRQELQYHTSSSALRSDKIEASISGGIPPSLLKTLIFVMVGVASSYAVYNEVRVTDIKTV